MNRFLLSVIVGVSLMVGVRAADAQSTKNKSDAKTAVNPGPDLVTSAPRNDSQFTKIPLGAEVLRTLQHKIFQIHS